MLYYFLIIKHIRNEEYVDTFYTMTNSFPTLSMTTVSSYRTIAWILKLAAAFASGLYLKINCYGSLVTFSV